MVCVYVISHGGQIVCTAQVCLQAETPEACLTPSSGRPRSQSHGRPSRPSHQYSDSLSLTVSRTECASPGGVSAQLVEVT